MNKLPIAPPPEDGTQLTRQRKIYLNRVRQLTVSSRQRREHSLLPLIDVGLQNASTGSDPVLFIAGSHHSSEDLPWQLMGHLSLVEAAIDPPIQSTGNLRQGLGIFKPSKLAGYEISGLLLTADAAQVYRATIKRHKLWNRAFVGSSIFALLILCLGFGIFSWPGLTTIIIALLPAALILITSPTQRESRQLSVGHQVFVDVYVGPELFSMAMPGTTLAETTVYWPRRDDQTETNLP